MQQQTYIEHVEVDCIGPAMQSKRRGEYKHALVIAISGDACLYAKYHPSIRVLTLSSPKFHTSRTA